MTWEQHWIGTLSSTQELKYLVEFEFYLKWFLPRVDFIISLGLRGLRSWWHHNVPGTEKPFKVEEGAGPFALGPPCCGTSSPSRVRRLKIKLKTFLLPIWAIAAFGKQKWTPVRNPCGGLSGQQKLPSTLLKKKLNKKTHNGGQQLSRQAESIHLLADEMPSFSLTRLSVLNIADDLDFTFHSGPVKELKLCSCKGTRTSVIWGYTTTFSIYILRCEGTCVCFMFCGKFQMHRRTSWPRLRERQNIPP